MKKLIHWGGILIFLLSHLALAHDDTVDAFAQVNNSFFAGLTVMHLNYREDVRAENPQLPGDVQDFGLSYGLALNLRNTFFTRLYTDFYGEYTFGKLQYEGFDILTDTPKKHKKSHDFANLDLKLGIILLDNSFFQVIPYGGVGFRYWAFGSTHTYYNFKALGGAKIHCLLADKLVVSPYINLGTTLGARAKAKQYGANSTYLGTTTFLLGNKLIREIGLELNYRLEQELFLTAVVSHTHFKYGRSEQWLSTSSKPFIEPNSKTNELRFSLGIRYGFL